MDNANVADISVFEQLQANQNELHNVNLMSVFNDFNEVKRLITDYITTVKRCLEDRTTPNTHRLFVYYFGKLDSALAKEMSRIESLPETERAKAKKAVEMEIKRIPYPYDVDAFTQYFKH
jgi:hypothetical protein